MRGGPHRYGDDGGRRRYEPYGHSSSIDGSSHSAYYAANGIGPSSSSRSNLPSHDGLSRGVGSRAVQPGRSAVSRNHKDFGFAFIGRDMEERVKQIVKDSDAALLAPRGPPATSNSLSKGNSTPLPTTPSSSRTPHHIPGSSSDDRGDTTPTSTQTQSRPVLTPTMIVDEFKRAGHFDAVRKKLLQTFNGNSAGADGSSFKKDFLDSIGDYLLQRLRDLPDEARQNLAKREARLQHSEVTRWIDEDARGARVMGDAVEELRRRGMIFGQKSEKEDDGDVGRFLKEKLGEIVRSERRARGWTEGEEEKNEPEHEHEHENEEEDGATAVKSKVKEDGMEENGRAADQEVSKSQMQGEDESDAIPERTREHPGAPEDPADQR